MKFALASLMLIGTTVAFSSPAFTRQDVSVKMSAIDTDVYTFKKSEEMMAEAKTVSSIKHITCKETHRTQRFVTKCT